MWIWMFASLEESASLGKPSLRANRAARQARTKLQVRCNVLGDGVVHHNEKSRRATAKALPAAVQHPTCAAAMDATVTCSVTEVVPSSQLSTDGQLRPLVVYLVRHAEARHNVEEKRVVKQASLSGATKEEADEARKAALWADESLRDATLSQEGAEQVGASALGIKKMLSDTHYGPPELVLVSPLRRTLQTATGLFGAGVRVSAIEALREKRTGMACDERHSVLELQAEFPHIDFSEMRRRRAEFPTPEHGEDNAAVRRRALAFLDGLPALAAGCSTIAIVSHKGWLRELRAGLQAAATAHGQLRLDFDLDLESQPVLFGNAEVRVAEFSWRRQGQVVDGLLHDDGLVLSAIVSLHLQASAQALTLSLNPSLSLSLSPSLSPSLS